MATDRPADSATATVPARSDRHAPLLEIRDLKTWFHTDRGTVRAVDGVDLVVGRNRTLGLVGESGCGKTVTALSIMGLVPPATTAISGSLLFRRKDDSEVDLAQIDPQSRTYRRIRGGEIAMIFQEPMTSLNPVYIIGNQITEAIQLHQDRPAGEGRERAVEMLRQVGIADPGQRAVEYPHQLSGGMRQRVMIAMALSCNPSLLVADEPTTAAEGLAGAGERASGAGAGAFSDAPGAVVDLATLDRGRLKRVRREVQMIFQDPNSSLNPRMTVQQILVEPFLIHAIGGSKEEIEERVVTLMGQVGLRPEQRSRYPHQFSAGQRQRIGIARALALNPKLVIADEPVSALDVSIQGQVLNLLEDLQAELGLTYVFIAHDLSVVEHISDWVAVMYLGRLVELARGEDLYRNPQHPYTEALLSAVQVPDPDVQRKRIILEGGVPSPANPPTGCRFHTRCPYAAESGHMQRCSTEVPELALVGDEQWVACHFAADLDLRGVEVPAAG